MLVYYALVPRLMLINNPQLFPVLINKATSIHDVRTHTCEEGVKNHSKFEDQQYRLAGRGRIGVTIPKFCTRHLRMPLNSAFRRKSEVLG